MKYTNLLKPGKIGKMELRNRMIMPGMGTNLAASDGTVSDTIVNYYARRANGGVGLIITEVCCPDPAGAVIPGEIEASSDHFMPGLSRIPHAVHAGGAKACLQLAHGGCFSSEWVTGQPSMTPSGVGTLQLPGEHDHIMTVPEIKHLIEQYGEAARRARDCGFDAVELHGAHGYMPLQFLSAYTNHRTDEYGGSLENRARFALETIRSIKEHAGEDFTLIYRLSAEEDAPNGVTLAEACAFAKMAQAAGVDAINVSAGTWDSRLQNYNDVMAGKLSPKGLNLSKGVATSMWVPPTYTPRGTLVDLAAGVKKAIDIPVIAVCSITPEMGEDILEKDNADFIAMGRQIIADPDYPEKIRQGKPDMIRRCLRCNECLGAVMRSCAIACSVNPEAGMEADTWTDVHATKQVKKVAIIGGGPAGMEAAQVATERGHQVTLFEKNDKLGGALHYVSLPDFKIDYREYTKYMVHATKTCGATIKTGISVTSDDLKDFDTILVATGAHTFVPNIGDASKSTGVLDPLKVLDGHVPSGKEVLICGAGLVGCEVAMDLAEKGKKVTMIDMVDDVAPELAVYTKWVLKSKLAELGVTSKTGHKITQMSDQQVTCEVDGQTISYHGDAVVCALGLKPVRGLWKKLQDQFPEKEIIPIGDVNAPRKVLQATHEGFHAARRI